MSKKSGVFIVLTSWLLLLASCKQEMEVLPVLGQKYEEAGETIYHTIRPFEFINQEGEVVTNTGLSKKIYVADFFFTSCPSICPKVTKEMLTVYEAFDGHPGVQLVSFTLDPKRDTIGKLKLYADNLEVKADNWYFLTGDKDATLELAQDFFVHALEDDEAPGGFNHSGQLVLIDKKGRIRAFVDGTDEGSGEKMIAYVQALLHEYEQSE